MVKKFTLSIFSAVLLFGSESVVLEPLEVVSTSIKTDELKSTDAVEVYTQKDIENAHVQNVYEFLNKNSSVFATSAYGNPFMQKIDMRGYGVGNGYQNIVVTLNGRKMNNVDMVPQLLASITPSSVDRIEIVKSSGIVTEGDGANAGVINIITKQSDKKDISFYIGNYGLVDGAFHIGHKGEKLSINLSGEAQKSDGIRTIDANGNKDENKLATASLDLSYRVTDSFELLADFSGTNTDVVYGGTMTKQEYEENPKQQGSSWGYPSVASVQAYNTHNMGIGFVYDIGENYTLSAKANKEKKRSDFAMPAYFSTGLSLYDYTTANMVLAYEEDRFDFKIGVDSFDADLDYENSYGVKLAMKKKNQAAFVLSSYNIGNTTFKAGYRYESMRFSESTHKSEKEYLHGVEASVNQVFDTENSAYFSYSHGFETAQLDRLFSYTNPATGYMGYVEPAISDNFTIGYNNFLPNNKLKISIFYIKLKNEIYYYEDPAYINSKNTNIDRSYKYGFELYDRFLINESFLFTFNYNYVKAIIDKEIQNGEDFSGNELPGVSNHNVKATLNYLPNKYATIALTQIYRSDAYAADDFGNNFAQKQEAYYSTDISASYAKENWEIFAKINNLFNQKNGLWIQDDAIYPVNFTTTAYVGFKLKY